MEPVTSVILAWSLFAGTHIGLASSRVRPALVARVGEQGFGGLFSLVAALTFSLLAYVYSSVETRGPAGLALGDVAVLRWPLVGLSVLGIVCAVASLFDYGESAYALSSAGRKAEASGFERISRHGFAVGLGLVGVAHALLATHLTGTVMFAALAVFTFAGSAHQDAKLRARHPESHGAYLAQTSMLPFAAILTGRNRLVLAELRALPIGLGLVAAWALRLLHPWIFARGGLYVVAVTLAGAALATVQDLRRARQRSPVATGTRA